MQFIQIIDYTTTRSDEVGTVVQRWAEQTEGRRTASRAYATRDRDASNRYVDIIVVPSYEEAQRNSQLPETKAMAEKVRALCEAAPVFQNLDVLRADELTS